MNVRTNTSEPAVDKQNSRSGISVDFTFLGETLKFMFSKRFHRLPSFLILVLSCLMPSSFAAQSPESKPNSGEELITRVQSALDRADEFQRWLSSNENYWASCRPKRVGQRLIHLCDGTQISVSLIESLFKKSPGELIQFIRSEGIHLQVICNPQDQGVFFPFCDPKVARESFRMVTGLHGQYIPSENKIVIQSNAHQGSLVHEYLHYLQFKNDQPTKGRIYKSSRVKIEKDLVSLMDEVIGVVQKKEREGNKDEALRWVKPAKDLGTMIASFSKWQKLIDERSLFLLFIENKEILRVTPQDEGLAVKNMGFLCKDPQTSPILSKTSECLMK